MPVMKRLLQVAAVAAAATTAQAAIGAGCASAQWNSTEDFWGTKFIDTDFESNVAELPFIAAYHNTYVRIMTAAQDRYIVLHCTDEVPPASAVGEDSLVVKVPVTSVAALDGLSQNFIDMLGMSSTIKKVGEESSVTSACIRANIVDSISYPQSLWSSGPEHVDVVFFDDDTTKDTSKVLLKNDATMSPLRTAAYIKLIGMFYGLEDLAVSLYDEIESSYRCAAATVQEAVKKGSYPTNHFISAVSHEDGVFSVAQNPWWTILANDAGVSLVDVTAEGSLLEDQEYAVSSSSASTNFAKQSWAIVDTTQYAVDSYGADSVDADRLDKESWLKLSGASKSAYAVKNDNVYLADKSFNKYNRHNFLDLAPTRPDVILRDLISLISPGFLADYETSFLRALGSTDIVNQARLNQICVAPGAESASLDLTSCAAPASGLSTAVGLVVNAYARTSATSAALAKSGLSKGATIGAAVGGSVGGAILIAGLVVGALFWRRRRALHKRNGDDDDMELPHMEKTISASSTESEKSVVPAKKTDSAV